MSNRWLGALLVGLSGMCCDSGVSRSPLSSGEPPSADHSPETGISGSETAAVALGPAVQETETPLEPTADCLLPPRIEPTCMDGFCRIEPGCYVMGAPRSEFFVGLYSDRQVQVTLTRPFELGETEVTRGQWFDTGWELPTQQGFCDTADCPECCLPDDCSSDDCPIYNVSLFDVLAFANHLSELRGLDPCYVLDDCTGEVGSDLRCESMMLTRDTLFECEGYRLPAESEWEYAARAGTKTAWFTGDIVPRGDGDCHEEAALEPVGWYCHNSGIRVHPVAQKLANPWGLYDTAGNVAEWVNDIYDPSGYGEGPHVDFAGQRLVDRNLVSAEEGSYTLRSSRSGMAHYMPYATKVNRQIPFFDDGYGVGLGFRLARTLDPQASP